MGHGQTPVQEIQEGTVNRFIVLAARCFPVIKEEGDVLIDRLFPCGEDVLGEVRIYFFFGVPLHRSRFPPVQDGPQIIFMAGFLFPHQDGFIEFHVPHVER